MVQSVFIRGETPCREARGRPSGRPVGLALAIASITLSAAPARAEAPAELPAQPAAAEARLAYQGRTEIDRLRSLDCLAQAIYYEAGRESEDGQRAVAQVVLNRVRHPAWPDSICGVVYQGPMRPGGGCQFTFTCDGALATPPTGEAWDRARELAAEAIAGYVHARAGLATHYHARYVSPAWAPRLRRTAAIGLHRFYRFRGRGGEPAAFTDAYTGVELLPLPAPSSPRRGDATDPILRR